MEYDEKFRPHHTGLSDVMYRRLFRHQVWLSSKGRFGNQLEIRGTGNSGTGGIGIFPWKRPDLDGVDFSKSVFVNVILRGATLRDAQFVGAELRSVTFQDCDVEGANFSGATLENVSFKGSNYSLARFDNVNTEHVDWNGERPVPKVPNARVSIHSLKL